MPAIRSYPSISRQRENYDPYYNIHVREDPNPAWYRLEEIKHKFEADSGVIGRRCKSYYSHLEQSEFNRPVPKHLKPIDPRPPPLKLSDLTALRTLGCGAFGSVVYAKTARAAHPFDKPGSVFAVKIIEKKYFRDLDLDVEVAPEIKQMERSILSELAWNPFICGLVGTFIDPLNVYYAFEFCPQTSLREALAERLSPHVVQFFFCGITAGLAFIHDNDIIHRDLKPENVFIGPGGYPCIGDFGTARRMQDDFFQLGKSKDGVEISSPLAYFDWRGAGTYVYQAPEQYLTGHDHHFGPSVDWWAAGVVLYEMLTRRMPFYSSNDNKAAEMIKLGRFRWPNELRIGKTAKALVSSLLTLDPLERLGTYGVQEVMDHPWFRNVDWTQIQMRQYLSPYRKNAYRGPEERWHELPLPRQQNVSGLPIAEPPLELQFDERFKWREI